MRAHVPKNSLQQENIMTGNENQKMIRLGEQGIIGGRELIFI